MIWHVTLKKNAYLFLEKLDFNDREKLKNAIDKLKDRPRERGKIIGGYNSGITFYEKRLFFGPGFRIYYAVLDERLIVARIQYTGSVKVHKIGTKKTQKKDIKNLKKL